VIALVTATLGCGSIPAESQDDHAGLSPFRVQDRSPGPPTAASPDGGRRATGSG
jgi:hypothetical protein